MITAYGLLETRNWISASGPFGICNSFAASVDVVDAEAVVSKSHVSLPNDCSVLAHFRENKPGREGSGKGGIG